jgi:hypothetical protein
MAKTFLNLGRYGDVIALLPVLKKENDDSGEKPRLIISKDYCDILDGVSYVEPVIYDGTFDDISGALKFAKRIDEGVITSQVVGIPDVVVSQVYGQNHTPKIICDSFQQDLWRLADRLDLWPKQPPLVFDKRSKKREAKLIKYIPTYKPWVVISAGGFSSPFPYRELLMEIVTHCLRDFHIVDLAKVKAEKFFDLLGIMDHPNTAAMILTDSGPLHLSYATKKPVHAVVTDSPSLWHGAAWRPSYASYTRYQNFPRDVTRILDLIRNPPVKPKLSNIIHVYQRTPWATGEEKRRNQVAAKSWEGIGCVDLGLDDNCFVRSSAEMVPDETKRIPMIKDMLRLACVGRDDSDVLLLTNTDTCIASNVLEKIVGVLPAYAYRKDFKRLDAPIKDKDISKGDKYAGCDFFAIRVGWWRKNHALFPDMILGRHSWDRIMRELIKSAGGREIENIIYHERHPSGWEDPRNINRDPSNLRNCKLAREWLQERKMPLLEIEALNYEGKFKRPDFNKLKV